MGLLVPCIGNPSVVALAERDLTVGVVCDRAQKDGRVKHLNVRAKFIHVLDSRGNVIQFSDRLDRLFNCNWATENRFPIYFSVSSAGNSRMVDQPLRAKPNVQTFHI
jgi:hypothetical protein